MTQTRADAIAVTIRAFALYRERLGRSELALTLPPGATVQVALDALAKAYPQIAPYVDHTMVAVNQEYADHDQPLSHGDELALIPPVSGGQGAALDPYGLRSDRARDEHNESWG
jgi:molybdopterin converting factor subunit 1